MQMIQRVQLAVSTGGSGKDVSLDRRSGCNCAKVKWGHLNRREITLRRDDSNIVRPSLRPYNSPFDEHATLVNTPR
jgi:hypothetical protein